MNNARWQFHTEFINWNSGDQKSIFKAAKTFFNFKSDVAIPDYRDSDALAEDIGKFFVHKIEHIRLQLDQATAQTSVLPTAPPVSSCWESFTKLTNEDMQKLILKSSNNCRYSFGMNISFRHDLFSPIW